MSKQNQSGFGTLEAILVVVLIGLLSVVGWYVYRANQHSISSDDFSDSSIRQSEIPEVNSSSDLKKSEDYLNSQDLDKELNTSEIDAALEDE